MWYSDFVIRVPTDHWESNLNLETIYVGLYNIFYRWGLLQLSYRLIILVFTEKMGDYHTKNEGLDILYVF